MSNIFAPLVRPFGTLPVELDSGPVVGATEYMHMLVSDDGELYVSNDAIHHYGAALPFDINGRVVVSTDAVVRWDQGIPFTASEAVAMDAAEVVAWDQGLTFLASGHIAVGDIAPPPEPPIWSAIPNKNHFLYELPQLYDVSPYVAEAGSPITSYALIGAPDFFTIDQAGVITCAVGTAAAVHVLTVEATNGIGSSTTTFTWTLSTGNVPTWGTIPPQQHRVNELPKSLDIKPYAFSDSGPILSYSLVLPPPGITMADGIITVDVSAVVGSYLLTVRATNGVGAGDTTFTWDILEELVAPVWSPIPNQSDIEVDLPQTFDVTPYVTSNAGALRNWTLITPPPGFSIDQSGVVTAAAGTAIANHTIVVDVLNDQGSSSSSFQWIVQEDLLPPLWSTVPNQESREDTLPQQLDAKPYVSSNSGALTSWALITPPAGFTISASGIITAAAGIAPGTYPLTVQVANDTGTTASAPFNWEITLFYLAPVWSVIPPRTTGEDALPTTYNVSSYAVSNHGPLTGWALVAPPAGFTIDSGTGIITAANTLAVGTYPLIVEVSNLTGTSQSLAFDWEITLFYIPPVWSTIPDQGDDDSALPVNLDVAPYVTSNSGPLTSWTLVTPPAGFSISAAGVITVAFGTAPGNYNVTVSVSNDEGASSSDAFSWTIASVLLPPQWSTIPDQTTGEDVLPVTLDAALWVSTNSGPLTGWQLVAPPAGFSIDSDGLITVAAGVAPAGYSIQVRVSNNTGLADSQVFNWQINSVYLVPQWTDINNKGVDEDNLPANRDTSTSVSSNHGALFGWTILNPTAGFSISTGGVVTAADGTAPGDYFIQAAVSNLSGQSQMTDNGWAPWRFRIRSVYLPPQWITIPDQSTEEQLLPVVLDVKPYVSTNHGPLANWSLVSPPGGWTISADGIITVAAARPVGSNQITVRVDNDSGSSDSAAFTWDILEEPLVPQWDTIPTRQDRVETLPQSYDVSPWVTSNAGSLTTWTLISPPTGFSINTAGLITAAAGTTVAIHPLTVRVSNDVGSADQTFNWEVQETLLLPQWSTVPDRSDRINTLPQNYGMSAYVSSNAGSLVLWRLSSAPPGFSISSTTGVITATASAGVGTHSLRVGVTNSLGESLSNTFDWTILEELLPPQWSTIPGRSDDDDTLPQTYNVAPYVTSNSGSLDTWSLRSAPAGFTISQSGVITASTGANKGNNTITVRVYNDEGSADKSFNWEIVEISTSEYYQEFNATLGFWNHYRSSAAWGYDKDDNPRQVGVDVPVYVNCGYSGSAFVPNAAFLGIRCDFESTNEVLYNSNYTSSGWATADSTFTANTWSPSNAGANSFGYRIQSGTNDIVMSMYNEIEVSGNWASLAMSPDGVIGVVLDESPGLHRTIAEWSSQSWQYPMIITNGGSTGRVYLNWMQIEREGADGATGPIQTSGTAVTRDRDALFVANTDIDGWSANDLTDGFCGQAKFRAHVGKGTSSWLQLYCIVDEEPDPSESNYFSVWMSSSNIRAAMYVGGSQTDLVSIAHVLQPGEDYDIRWRVDPNGNGVKLWITGGGLDTSSQNSGSPSIASNNFLVHKWGSWFINTQTGGNSTTLKSLRIVKEVKSDAEIEAWA